MGAAGGVLMQIVAGKVVQYIHTYLPLFLFSGIAYLAALVIIQALTPKLAPAPMTGAGSESQFQ